MNEIYEVILPKRHSVVVVAIAFVCFGQARVYALGIYMAYMNSICSTSIYGHSYRLVHTLAQTHSNGNARERRKSFFFVTNTLRISMALKI